MSRSHAPSGPPPDPAGAPPKPSYAERARTLAYLGRVGTLSTVSAKHPGWPFGSVMPYGLDAQGRPAFLISRMAMHTQNVVRDGRASLLVTQPGKADDPLGAGRMTVMGEVKPVEDGDLSAIRENYLQRYPDAKYWVDFDDFDFYRMQPMDLYFVGGFGVMGWVNAEDYLASQPDPLADAASRIIDHMNDDHESALIKLAGAHLQLEASAAQMTAVDRLGFHVRLTTADGMKGGRIAFPREVRSSERAREVFVEMVREPGATRIHGLKGFT